MATTDSSVQSIVDAFGNGLDILMRVRVSTRTRKSKAGRRKDEGWTDDEFRLRVSLEKGPVDVYGTYDKRLRRGGAKYAQGDDIVRASLMSTLLKLNTGLVGIISAFLNNGGEDAILDYRGLTKLSDESREETIEALRQLYYRISHSDTVITHLMPTCGRCERKAHRCSCHSHGESKSSKSRPKDDEKRRLRHASRHKEDVGVQRIRRDGDSEPQLVLVRPRRRRESNSSTASSPWKSSASTAVATPIPSPPDTPTTPSSKLRGRSRGRSRRPPPERIQSMSDGEDYAAPTPSPRMRARREQSAHPAPYSHIAQSASRRAGYTDRQAPPPPYREENWEPTPSHCSFVSSSTKLGEVPMRNWTVPFNEGEARRLNAKAMNAPYPWHNPPEMKERSRSFFRFWRRSDD